MRKYIIFDTETTGLTFSYAKKDEAPAGLAERGDEVCQIGGIICDEKMIPYKLFCHYCDTIKPQCDPKAFAVNEIDMEEVRKYVRCEYLSKVISEYIPEFLEDDIVFIGYNVKFDLQMVKQTLANMPGDFTYEIFTGNMIPTTSGRIGIDVMQYYTIGSPNAQGKIRYRKLSSFDTDLERARTQFLNDYGDLLVETNCSELFNPSWNKCHNSFYDSINTFLLWRDDIWKTKLI